MHQFPVHLGSIAETTISILFFNRQHDSGTLYSLYSRNRDLNNLNSLYFKIRNRYSRKHDFDISISLNILEALSNTLNSIYLRDYDFDISILLITETVTSIPKFL